MHPTFQASDRKGARLLILEQTRFTGVTEAYPVVSNGSPQVVTDNMVAIWTFGQPRNTS
jgi:hypothetical protein